MSSPKDFDPDRWSRTLSSSSLEDRVDDRRLGHPTMPAPLGGRKRAVRSTIPSGSQRFAVLEIPLRLDDAGVLSMERKTNLTAYSSFPVAGSWLLAELGASTHMRGRTGYATAKGDIYYTVGPLACLRGGVVVMGEERIPNLLVGGTVYASATKTSSLTATIQTRRSTAKTSTTTATPNWAQKDLILSLSGRQVIDPRLTLFGSCSINPSSFQHPTSVQLQLQSSSSKTVVHPWKVGLGWQSQRPSFSFHITPQLWSVSHRRGSRQLLQLSASWQGGKTWGWTLGGTLTTTTTTTTPTTTTTITTPQKPSLKPATVGSKISVGLTHSSMLEKGLVWVFSFTQGGFTLRIPIVLASVVSSSNSSSLWYPVSVLYIAMLSRIIQDMVAQVLQRDDSIQQASDQQWALQQQQQQLNREKAQEDAAQQQRFMERQAKIRTEAQEQKNGLVIRKALYHVDKGDCWDVTIPLQFWVTDDSTLQLAESSKRHMLGFYNVAASVSSKKNKKEDPPPLSSSSPLPVGPPKDRSSSRLLDWAWTSIMTPFLLFSTNGRESDKESSTTNPVLRAKLTVQYDLAGHSYEITIPDNQELVLPSPMAVHMDP